MGGDDNPGGGAALDLVGGIVAVRAGLAVRFLLDEEVSEAAPSVALLEDRERGVEVVAGADTGAGAVAAGFDASAGAAAPTDGVIGAGVGFVPDGVKVVSVGFPPMLDRLRTLAFFLTGVVVGGGVAGGGRAAQ